MSTVTPGHPMFCAKQAKRTPMIPTHNGWPTCLRCGFDTATAVAAQRAQANNERNAR